MERQEFTINAVSSLLANGLEKDDTAFDKKAAHSKVSAFQIFLRLLKPQVQEAILYFILQHVRQHVQSG